MYLFLAIIIVALILGLMLGGIGGGIGCALVATGVFGLAKIGVVK